MTECLLLGTASHVIETRVGQLDHMERVRDQCRRREAVTERLAVGPRQVDHAPADGIAPRLGAGLEPIGGGLGRSALHDVE